MNLEELLTIVHQRNASDLHISTGLPPVIRVDGKLIRTDYPPMTNDEIQKLIFSILNNEQRRNLEQNWELDCSYGFKDMGRFRVNVYKEKGNYAAAFRTITSDIPSFDQLGLPEIVREVAERPRGLILVTGPTGSGKSTTLATMIDHINMTRSEHILTIEDPVEFVHKSKRSIVHQRELNQDTRSFSNALRAALREDPDIILVGELRDLETIQLAITAAETGHLVLGTLHTSSASQTIDRIVDVFPSGQQQQVRIQLSNSLIAVFSQTLLARVGPDGQKKGRILAQEIMIVTPAIANLVREGKTAQVYSAIQTGASHKMVTLEAALTELYRKRLVTYDDALSKTSRIDDLKRTLDAIPKWD